MPPKKSKPIFEDVLGRQPKPKESAPEPAPEPETKQPEKAQILTDSLAPDSRVRKQVSPIIQSHSESHPAAALPDSAGGVRMTPVAEKRKDTRKREPIVNFRCIPAELKSDLDQLSIHYDIPVGILASFIFESGLKDVENGDLVLTPSLSKTGYTLYPQSAVRAGRPINGKVKKDKGTIQIAFRGVSQELKQRMIDLSKSSGMHSVAVGEVARALLEYGIEHIQSGHWTLGE